MTVCDGVTITIVDSALLNEILTSVAVIVFASENVTALVAPIETLIA